MGTIFINGFSLVLYRIHAHRAIPLSINRDKHHIFFSMYMLMQNVEITSTLNDRIKKQTSSLAQIKTHNI